MTSFAGLQLFTLLEPAKRTSAFLRDARSQDFSYPEVGATRGTLPDGYDIDHNRVKLGQRQPGISCGCFGAPILGNV